MCAIFGIIGENNLNLLKKMSLVQVFRGPDKQDFYVNSDDKICIGNNRLSVIDIKHGHQPMYSSNKKYIIVFNGTIYNFREIKSYLSTKGIKFKTNSDTEVIANGYSYWKDEIFNFFDGMWALAIYDVEKKELILSRDYLGQKPLYFEIQKNKILFSSQINGITQDKNYKREIDYNSLKKYHFSSFIEAPGTIFKSIKQVRPAEIVKIDLKSLKVKNKIFWDLNDGPDYNIFFLKDKNNLNVKFNEIINNYSVSDIKPVGLLSSGIDSYLVNKYLTMKDKNFETFTMGFEDKSYDEVKNFNKEFDLFNKNFFIPKKNEIFENTKELLNNIDHLCGDSSLIPTYSLIKKIKKKSKVLISGDGGDEAFLGYITFKALFLAKKIKYFPSIFLTLIGQITNFLPINYNYLSHNFKIKKFFSKINSNINILTPLWMSPLAIKDLNKLFNENIKESSLYDQYANLSDNYLRNAQLYFYKFYLPYSVLFKTDFASMLNSVEYRSPLLSKNIINYSLNMNIDKSFSLITQKKSMVDSFENQIPKSISKIPKHGFAFPKHLIINRENIDEILIEKNLINKNFFYNKLENYLNKKEECSQYLWNEIIFTNVLNNVDQSIRL